jgi:hypothetical protein
MQKLRCEIRGFHSIKNLDSGLLVCVLLAVINLENKPATSNFEVQAEAVCLSATFITARQVTLCYDTKTTGYMIMVFAHSFACANNLLKQSALHNMCSYNQHNHG